MAHKHDEDQDRDALIAAVVAAFLLAATEIAALAGLFYTARLAALIAAYLANAREAGADVSDTWQPPDDATSQMQDECTADAQGVAQTYDNDLNAAALAFVLAWQSAHDGSLDGAGPALRDHLGQWSAERVGWKAEQIARAETALGAAQGAELAAADVTAGTWTDADGNPLDASQLVCAVLPDSAAEPFCIEYAGNFYPLEAFALLAALFPAHLNCPHQVVILQQVSGDTETEWSFIPLLRATWPRRISSAA